MLSHPLYSFYRQCVAIIVCCFLALATVSAGYAKPAWKDGNAQEPGTKGGKGGKKKTTTPQIVIEEHPVSQVVLSGDSVVFSVVAYESGGAELSYQWYVDGTELTGANQSILSISSASLSDNGNYHARVYVSNTSVNSNSASLVVEESAPPVTEPDIVISLHPVSQAVQVYQDVTLNVSASGSGSLAYQWRKDGVAIDGEIKSYLTLSQVTEADAAAYDVVISNETGVVASSAAMLTITPLAQVQLSWDTPTQREDGSVLLAEEIDSYRIYISYISDGSATELDVPASQNALVLDELLNGEYKFEIATRDTSGALGNKSPAIQLLVN